MKIEEEEERVAFEGWWGVNRWKRKKLTEIERDKEGDTENEEYTAFYFLKL